MATSCPDGEEGEIAIRTTPDRPIGLFPGYWRNQEANENCFRGDWYYTGDRATRDEDGYFWFIGRADDVIISASYRIGPFEVESALLEHDAVAEAAVIAKPDPTRTNIVKAFVVLAPGYEPSERILTELQDHVKITTAPYKYPRERSSSSQSSPRPYPARFVAPSSVSVRTPSSLRPTSELVTPREFFPHAT